jgi:hypothetical protein
MKHISIIVFSISLGCAIFAACARRNAARPAEEQLTYETEQKVPTPMGEKPRETHEYLEIRLTNQTEGFIDQTSVSFGTNQCTFGVLGSGGSSTYLGWLKAVGTNATLKWREQRKTPRTASADLLRIYDPTKAGRLEFAIAGTNVTVTFTKIDRR